MQNVLPRCLLSRTSSTAPTRWSTLSHKVTGVSPRLWDSETGSPVALAISAPASVGVTRDVAGRCLVAWPVLQRTGESFSFVGRSLSLWCIESGLEKNVRRPPSPPCRQASAKAAEAGVFRQRHEDLPELERRDPRRVPGPPVGLRSLHDRDTLRTP